MHLLDALRLRQLQQDNSAPVSPSQNGNTTGSATITLGVSPAATSVPPNPGNKPSTPNTTTIVGVVAAIVGVLAIIFTWYMLRRTRNRHKNPKYVPTKFLKKLWEKWDPEPMHYRLPDNNDHLEPQRSGGLSRTPTPAPPAFDMSAGGGIPNTPALGVDRNTSVRSVMTLPAYHPSARESEQVLGREGERAGIDVVIEFPENNDEEEERREAEMEALYQVRLARRQENEEREERRRLRREARERGDYVALRELQARARAGSAASGRTVEELRAEHDRLKKERQRAVSSVSYGELGVARHDGTRLRANSNDSERDGLLGDAASMAASSQYHRRDRSAGSVISIDTMNSDMPSPRLTRSRGNSRASRPDSPSLRRPSGQSIRPTSPGQDAQAGSSPEMVEHDDFPPNSPPGYENISLNTPLDGQRQEPPPDYSSPIAGRGERRSLFGDPRSNTINTTTARASSPHIVELMNESGSSSSTRGVGGSPQLPSLRLSTLPSIQVNSPNSPIVQGPAEVHIPPKP